uniref:Kinesin motor domain-containing protein n=1 Tax=Chromera velia CCMP2878 TaxID=1169474 RepID=A0A0G4FFH2_9ALVE|eukprot:Cvel_16711.t1-p1 / transcript=Cvel_16711.t1 / gene=Cvel_16711 / organism=Chromera_velia_CCMP2878 / gene_product=Kinesin heavy chain isoform 5A, putative / transcript_product=Kinesin heavy chain isoform 5A, putative / location=Cvel_scaffold1298:39628-45227(-) / protein_length=759 / sequence_SO=supercontig / SO=protein_coding / is_pseudo=false
MGASISGSASSSSTSPSSKGHDKNGDVVVPEEWHYELLKFLPWEGRVSSARLLSKEFAKFFSGPFFEEFLCRRLEAEAFLFVPERPPPGFSWGSLFEKLWTQRGLFQKKDRDGQRETGNGMRASGSQEERQPVGVVVRFRPDRGRTDEDEEADGRRFMLPLHQRIHLIRRRDRTTTQEALKQLHREGGWFDNSWKKERGPARQTKNRAAIISSDASTVGGSSTETENETVDGNAEKERDKDRDQEKQNGQGGLNRNQLSAHIHAVDPGMGRVVMVAKSIGMRTFCFDHVLPQRSTQPSSYHAAARGVVSDFLNGFNGCVIVYGQTGSGKSHTMFGPPGPDLGQTCMGGRGSLQVGVVPRACLDILRAVEDRRRRGIECGLSASYVEVYGDEVTDLLRGGAVVGQNSVSAQRWVMEGEAQLDVSSLEDIAAALETGERQKRFAATAMNDRSSRAHALFILSLKMKRKLKSELGGVERERGDSQKKETTESEESAASDEMITVRSQLFLVDLGGSEQVKKSRVTHGVDAGARGFVLGRRMREAVHINLGLLALKKCISALNSGKSYVPFQDSKITMMLSPALGGKARACIVVCCSSDQADAGETLQSLRFAERCSGLSTSAEVGASAMETLLGRIDAQMEELEETIRQKERWETVEVVRADALVEENSFEASLAKMKGGEVVKTGKVVGAEGERARLEELIRERARLTGEDVDLRLAEMGFGGLYGGNKNALAGNAELRFGESHVDAGLVMKGKKIAQWRD